MPIEEAAQLADIVKQLSSFQLIIFFLIITQFGLFGVLLYIIKTNTTKDKQEAVTSENTFKMMSQIYHSFTSTTESFNREQEKDWKRTQEFFRAFNELFRLQKQIYYVIGQLTKRVDNIEKVLEIENGTHKEKNAIRTNSVNP